MKRAVSCTCARTFGRLICAVRAPQSPPGRVARLAGADISAEGALSLLLRDGAVILEGVASGACMDALQQELRAISPYA